MNLEERRTLLKNSLETRQFHAMLFGIPAAAAADQGFPIHDCERLSIPDGAGQACMWGEGFDDDRALECIIDIIGSTSPGGRPKKPRKPKKKKPAKKKKK